MEKTITNNTDTPQGYYDDSGLRIVQPGETIKLVHSNSVSEIALEDLSNPPPGCRKIKNIYVDPETGKTIVEFKDEPELEEE